ncbi:NosD domain-containing protein [Thermoproteota archaeon]
MGIDTSTTSITYHNSNYGIHWESADSSELKGIRSWNNDRGLFMNGCDGIIISDSNFSDNDQGGVSDSGAFIQFSDNLNISNTVFPDNRYGLTLWEVDDAWLRNISSTQNSYMGIRAEDVDNVTILNSNVIDSGRGIQVWDSVDVTLDNIVTEQNSLYGIWLRIADDCVVRNSSIIDNNDGLYIEDFSNDNLFYNNTIANSSGYGVYIESSSSTGNIFYHNDFINNTQGHVNSELAGNHFNTSVGGVAQGNFWDDIELSRLRIFDNNWDGWGDIGPDWPYNSSNGGNVSDYVNDYGPMMTDYDGDGDPDWHDCDDTDPDVVAPWDNLTVNRSITLCNGTYYVEDVGNDGAVIFNTSSVTLTCNETLMVGDGTGYALYADSGFDMPNIVITGCNLTAYSSGVVVDNATNANVSNIRAWNNSVTGVAITYSDNSDVWDVSAWSNMYGVGLGGSANFTVWDITTRDNQLSGFSLGGCVNSTVWDVDTWNNTYGFVLGDADEAIVRDVISWNNTYGFYLQGADNPVFVNVTAGNNTLGFYYETSNGSSVTNSTIRDSLEYGIYINDSANNNIYWNNFINNTLAQVYSNTAGNHFNTTVGGIAQGNYWDDIETSRILIFDNNYDGWGDAGPERPYSLANRGNVSDYVEDYGPEMTDGDGDGDPDWRDCDDNNASVLSPRDDLLVNRSITLCPGTFNVTDVAADGLLLFGADNVDLACNSTVLVGDTTGYGVYGSGYDGLGVSGCDIRNYSRNLYFLSGSDFIFRNLTLSDATYGAYFVGLNYLLLENSSISDIGQAGIRLDDVNHSLVNSTSFVNIGSISIDDTGTATYSINNSVTHSTFDDVFFGIVMAKGSYGGVFRDLNFHNVTQCAFRLYDSEDNIVEDIYINISTVDDGFDFYDLTDLYVDNVTAHNIYDDSFFFGNIENAVITNAFSYDSGNQGFTFDTINNSQVENIISDGSDDFGVYIYEATNSDFSRIYAYNSASYNGIDIYDSVGAISSFIDLVSADNAEDGIYISLYDGGIFTNLTSLRNGENGIVVSGSDDLLLTGLYSAHNTLDGIRFEGTALRNTVTNSTIYNNSRYGVYLDSGATGNLFYFNNFTNNSGVHVNATAAGNIFNTTIDGEGRGNYWDDNMSAFEIYDTDGDWWADSGLELPYSNPLTDRVSTNVEDYAPYTSRFVNCTLINTDIRGANVTLVPYYSRRCYLEDSNVSYSNVTNSVVINSTGVRTNIIDSYIINSTLNYSYVEFSEVLHAVFCGVFNVFTAGIDGGQLATGRINYNGTDYYAPAMLTQICAGYVVPYDRSAPTAPTVYDGVSGDDIDWFNDNTTLSAHWFGATEDMSTIYYRFTILENGTCLAGYCNWTSAGTNTTVTVTGLNLSEGRNYSFTVQAYNAYGNNASNATSDGAVLDITGPAAPTITSPTHPDQDSTYPYNDPLLYWNSSDVNSSGVYSGILGYSYLLNNDYGSAPDDVLEARPQITVQQRLPVDEWAPLKGNDSTDDAYAVFVEINQNVTAGDKLYTKIAFAENNFETDDIMTFVVYAIRKSDSAVIGNFDFNETGNAVTNIVEVSRDIAYASGPEDMQFYSVELTFNDTVNSSTNEVVYGVVVGIEGDEYSNDLMAGFSLDVDNTTNFFVIDDDNSRSDLTTQRENPMEIKIERGGDRLEKEYSNLPDGQYYFHAKAKDNAGNWGPVAHYNLSISTGGVIVTIRDPDDGDIFTSQPINVTVRTGDNASVRVIAQHPDGGNYTSTAQDVNGTSVISDIQLDQGINTLYAIATADNGISTTSTPVYIIYDLTPGFTNKTLLVRYSEAGDDTYQPYLVFDDAGAYTVGIATENMGATTNPNPMDIFSDTEFYTSKIFMTMPGASAVDIKDLLEADELLDQVNPMFGIDRVSGNYLIATQLRYEDMQISGLDDLPAGKYEIKIHNHGLTADGKLNITIVVS